MDYTKLVVFLLIVLGTVATFGSPITEDYPADYSEGPEEYPELSPDKTKELDTLKSDPDMGIFHEMTRNSKEHQALMRSDPALGNYPEMVPNSKEHGKLRDQDGKIVKRVAPGTVIAGAQLTIALLNSILHNLGKISRKIAIGVDNESGHTWNANNVYFFSGTSDTNPPESVKSGEALLWAARKTSGPVATGAVGVFTYCIPDIYKTLAVMHSVPFDYNFYKNWWNVKLYSGCIPADKSMYGDMYYDSDPFEGDNGWHQKYLSSDLSVKGAMASSGHATLDIKVYPR